MTKSIEQSVKARVKKIANSQGRDFGEVWLNVVFERWLARLFKSPHKDSFIFKGGMCLGRYLNIGRETRDLDFLIKGISSNKDAITLLFEEVRKIELADGFTFSSLKVSSLTHAHMKYPGYQVTMRAELGQTRTPVRIDLGVGDIVKPENLTIQLSSDETAPLFENEIELWAYPPETIFAEKYETAIRRDALNSRMKDYHDLVILVRSGLLDPVKTKSAIEATFKQRDTRFQFLPEFNATDLARMDALWVAHWNKVGRHSAGKTMPQNFKEICGIISEWVRSLPIKK